jgi:hypothetical protein
MNQGFFNKKALKSWADSLPDEFIECRDTAIGHDWHSVTGYRDGPELVEVIQCGRCKTEKERRMTTSGVRKNGKSSHYDPSYLRPKGSGHISAGENAVMRMAAFERRYVVSDLPSAPPERRRSK